MLHYDLFKLPKCLFVSILELVLFLGLLADDAGVVEELQRT